MLPGVDVFIVAPLESSPENDIGASGIEALPVPPFKLIPNALILLRTALLFAGRLAVTISDDISDFSTVT